MVGMNYLKCLCQSLWLSRFVAQVRLPTNVGKNVKRFHTGTSLYIYVYLFVIWIVSFYMVDNMWYCWYVLTKIREHGSTVHRLVQAIAHEQNNFVRNLKLQITLL